MGTAGESPLARSLSPDELGQRRLEWRALRAEQVERHVTPRHFSTRYSRRPGVSERLEQLVEAERRCCRLWPFDCTMRTISSRWRSPARPARRPPYRIGSGAGLAAVRPRSSAVALQHLEERLRAEVERRYRNSLVRSVHRLLAEAARQPQR